MSREEHTPLPPISSMLRMTFEKWHSDDIPRHAAVLAFYALFAMAPILLLCVEIMKLIYGADAAEALVMRQVTSFVGSDTTGEWVQTLLQNTLPSSATWWVTAGFVVALLFGASSFFGELKVVLNHIWGIPLVLDGGIGRLILRRIQAVVMVIASSLLIFFGLLLTSWLATITDLATTFLNLGSGYATWSYLFLIFFLLTVTFALIYQYVPDVDIAWRNVWIGAAATALLISVARLLITFYFSYSYTTTMFGAASAVVVILLSVYYSTQIFFLGAEFTYVYGHAFGSEWAADRIHPGAGSEHRRPPHPRPFTVNRGQPAQVSAPIQFEVENIAPAASPVAEVEPAKQTPFSWLPQIFTKPLSIPRWRKGQDSNEVEANTTTQNTSRLDIVDLKPQELGIDSAEPESEHLPDAESARILQRLRIPQSISKPFKLLHPRSHHNSISTDAGHTDSEISDSGHTDSGLANANHVMTNKAGISTKQGRQPVITPITNEPTGIEKTATHIDKQPQNNKSDLTTVDSVSDELADATASNPSRLRTIANRTQQTISLPFRIFQSIREIVIAVGVIGVLSVAALTGIPLWKRRQSTAAELGHDLEHEE